MCVFCAPLSFTACVWVDGYVIELGSVCFVGGRGFVISMAANFAFGVGPCVGIVEPFKRVVRVTTHPQILTLEL